jgi:hypothetical protein
MTLDFMSPNTMSRAPSHPYSPDLAPCDFYLFGCVTESLAGRDFADREELLAPVTRILEGIQEVTLRRVFRAWMDRVSRCNATNGEYVESILFLLEQNFVRHAQSYDAHECVEHPVDYCLNDIINDMTQVFTMTQIMVMIFTPHIMQICQFLDRMLFKTFKRIGKGDLFFDNLLSISRFIDKFYIDVQKMLMIVNIWA